MGILLCASFQPIIPAGYYSNHHNTPPRPYTLALQLDASNPYNPDPDRELACSIRDELEKYNCIVTWNGKMFDVPFLHSRLLFHGERPPNIQFHADMMYYAGGISNRIGSRRLQNVQQFLHLENEKTPLDWEIWKRAERGDAAALQDVVRHCEIDVGALGEAYWRLLPYIKNLHR